MSSSNQDYFPGTTVRVFDPSLYRDDISTPLSYTRRLATVTRWYGKTRSYSGQTVYYPSLVDVVFWHSGRESRGHFAEELYCEIVSKPSINETISNLPIERKRIFQFLLWDAFKGGYCVS